MLSEALQAPTRSDDAAGTLLVGSLLLLFSVLFPLVWVVAVATSPIWLVLAPLAIFPPLVLLGYDVRVLASGTRGEEATPSFVDWAGLVRDGLRALLLSGAYLLPLAVAVAVGAGGIWLAQSQYVSLAADTADALSGVIVVLESLFALAYLTVYLYVRPAFLAVFATTGSVRAALSLRRTLAVALTPRFALAWTLATLVLFVGWLVALPLQLLLVGFGVAFLVRVVAYSLFGRGARDALTADPTVTVEWVDEDTDENESAEATGTASSVPHQRTREADATVQTGRDVPIRPASNDREEGGSQGIPETTSHGDDDREEEVEFDWSDVDPGDTDDSA